MTRSIAIVAFLLLAGFGLARAQVSNVSLSACPKGTGYVNSHGDGDGCLGAPKGTPDNITLFQHPNFFTGYAAQSGQSYKTRPPWNVAGVDYPVGIPAGTVFKDPSKPGVLPQGCSYFPAGSKKSTPIIRCVNSKNPTFDGFDFSGRLTGSHSCVVMNFNDGTTGTITFRHSYFGRDASCTGAANEGLGITTFQINPGRANWDFEYNVIDFGPPVTGPGSSFRPLSLSPGTWTFKYNVWLNVPSDPIVGTSNGNFLAEYNYIENFIFDVTNQGHGEFVGNTGTGVQAQTYYFYNTILQGSAAQAGSTTTTIWLADGASGAAVTFSDAEVLNNTTVVNLGGGRGGKAISEAALVNMNETHTATQVKDNYFDSTGSYYIGIAAGAVCAAPVIWSGNYSLVTGAVVAKGNGGSTGGLVIDKSIGC